MEFIKYLRKRIHDDPDIRIGKRGIHENIIEATNELLKKRKGVIKIRVLRNLAQNRDDIRRIAQELSHILRADIVKIIGRSIIIGRIKDYKTSRTLPLSKHLKYHKYT